MFNVHFRAIASFVLAIFLTSICVVLIAWACDELKGTVSYLENEVEQQERRVSEIKEEGLVSYVTTSAAQGAVEGGVTGLVGGLYVGGSTSPLTGGVSMPVAVGVGVGIGVTSGWAGGSVGGAFDYYNDLSDAESELESLESQLATAKQELADCLNPPARYTYTDPNSGYVYEFTEETYGSASDAYTAYMKFLENRGH
ncbi:hypothetical protein F4Y93_05935 [Candidatus Poribacteria bacterium]|nr:hypothetical protein [Candidatus Poribacteria bacterium]